MISGGNLRRLGGGLHRRQMRPEAFSVPGLHLNTQAFAAVHRAHHGAAPPNANAGSDSLEPNCLPSLKLICHAECPSLDAIGYSCVGFSTKPQPPATHYPRFMKVLLSWEERTLDEQTYAELHSADTSSPVLASACV